MVVSAHWETTSDVHVTTSPQPSLLYDYYGFPEETYAPHLAYPCPGDPRLADSILGRLKSTVLQPGATASAG